MHNKLEILEDRHGKWYGVITNPEGRVIYFAPGFERLSRQELDHFIQTAGSSDDFNCEHDGHCSENPQAGYQDLTAREKGLSIIYDGERFLADRIGTPTVPLS